jgi:hypothetical protein
MNKSCTKSFPTVKNRFFLIFIIGIIGMLMLSNWYGIQAQNFKREAKRIQINAIEIQIANAIKKPQSVIDENMEDKKMALKILKLELKGILFFNLNVFLLSLFTLAPQIWIYSGIRRLEEH